MSEQNAQEQKSKKLFSQRGTSFLSLSSSYSGQVSTSSLKGESGEAAGAEHGETVSSEENPINAPENTQFEQTVSPTPEASPPEDATPRKTGVISSTIHYPPKPSPAPPQTAIPSSGNRSAARTAPIQEAPKPAVRKQTRRLSKEEKEEKLDNLAEKITSVLDRVLKIKTGVLSQDLRFRDKLVLLLRAVAEKNPALTKTLKTLFKPFHPTFELLARVRRKMIERKLLSRGLIPVNKGENHGNGGEDEVKPPERVSFLEMAEKNIIFCDNRKRPLYTLEQLKGKHGYTASEEVIAPMIFSSIMEAFQEVAPKARSIPTPQSGLYTGVPMEQVMANISEDEIMRFLNYVQKFPRGYVGKNFRITESFAGWVVSGTPDD